MTIVDPNLEWLGYVQPVGLVLSPAVLDRYGLVPEEQTRADTDAVAACLAPEDAPRALADPWTFFSRILGWREHQVAGLGGAASAPPGSRRPILEGLSIAIDEADTVLEPHWAVIDPEGRPTLLVRIEEPGVAPDERGALAGWEATPHQRFERLLRETGVETGLLITDGIPEGIADGASRHDRKRVDGQLRLVHAPKGETSGWLSFPLRALATVAGRPMLGGLKLALSAFRLHSDTPDRRLPGLLKQSRDAQAEVSAKLAEQVLGALHQLLRGLHAADETRIARLAASRPDHLYGGLLTVLLRLVFLLYAEDRGLVPSATDEEARRLYHEAYGVRSLHAKLTADSARYPDTMEERRGAWARLLVLFRLVHAGGGEGFIRARGGDLFDPGIYPFLMGRDGPADPRGTAPVSDGCILGVLDKLLVLHGERLSYRTLDVGEIGSVYETVMGFTVETMTGPALALRGGKNDRVPVFVDLAEIAALNGAERQKRLKDRYDVKLPEKVAKAVAAAKTPAEIEAALKPRVDERASPGATPVSPRSPLLQPTNERRRTGSHYTPRSLTEPIVRHALEPAFERLGPDVKPDDVLALKVCDPAMGSGAFLVEVCRQLAARLVKAWTRWPETRPVIPPDEDEDLHARRLIAQRCLYGVDKNPRAVELAKLSLWLATLARDHEFTFLDHALKCGDSLVGLDAKQIAAMHWDASRPGLPLFRKFVADRAAEATKTRAEIQSAPDDTRRIILEQKLRGVEKTIEHVRVLGDAVLSAFFAERKPRAREMRRATIESWVTAQTQPKWEELRAAAASLRTGRSALEPFHWPIEFPEVFAGEISGFDAIVGNPPYLGGTKISGALSSEYFDWLATNIAVDADKADLIAYFFRRIYNALNLFGTAGIVATGSIAKGDTRVASLAWVRKAGGVLYRATKRDTWPGEASVRISTVHVTKFDCDRQRTIDDRKVGHINSFLIDSAIDDDPQNLAANAKMCFEGFVPYGDAFVFKAENAAVPQELKALLASEPQTSEVLYPFIGGEEITEDPLLRPSRVVIFLGQMSATEARQRYPGVMAYLEHSVKPFRDSKSSRVANAPWWQFLWPRPNLWRKMKALKHVIVTPRVSKHHIFATLSTTTLPSTMLSVVTDDRWETYAALQSRVHQTWSLQFGGMVGETPRYNPSKCYGSFPFPTRLGGAVDLAAIGQAYHDYRAALMVARNEGLTKTYNCFHNTDERSEGTVRLRELHAEMDRAVLRGYGWDDLADRAKPIFLDETNEDDHTYQGRLFWPSAFRDEVLARLLALNTERAQAEKAAGIAPVLGATDEEGDEAEEAA